MSDGLNSFLKGRNIFIKDIFKIIIRQRTRMQFRNVASVLDSLVYRFICKLFSFLQDSIKVDFLKLT
jgi:hypothetical protein